MELFIQVLLAVEQEWQEMLAVTTEVWAVVAQQVMVLAAQESSTFFIRSINV
jgi:hypothetical protein